MEAELPGASLSLTSTFIPAAVNAMGSIEQVPSLDNNKILALLKCPVCFEGLIPPIYQCHQGHPLCNNCRNRVQVCPTCRTGPIDIRCLPLDHLAESGIMVACKYRENGCVMIVDYASKKQHEFECPYKTVCCFNPGCNFQDSNNNLAAHLVAKHRYPQLTKNKINISSKLRLPNTDSRPLKTKKKILYSFWDKHFILEVRCRGYNKILSFSIILVEFPSTSCSSQCNLQVQVADRTYTYNGPVGSFNLILEKYEKNEERALISGSFKALAAVEDLQVIGEIL